MIYGELIKISNPEKVLKTFRKENPNVVIEISNRREKKYMIIHPVTNRKIHFGSTMQDYTKNKDNKRRDNFRARARKWEHAEKYTPAWLSFRYLW